MAVRLSGSYSDKAGFADVYTGALAGAPFMKDANYERYDDYRAVVLWKPTGNVQLS